MAPEVLHAVSVNVPIDVLNSVVNDLVGVLAVQSFIRLQSIGEQLSAGFDVLFDERLEWLLFPALYYRSPNNAATLHDANHHRLVLAASSGDLLRPDVLVHVPGFLADEGFICFHLSSRLVEAAGSGRTPNSMGHKPRSLLGDIKRAVQFHRTDASAPGEEKPNCREPLVKAKRRILEDGPDLDGELLFARLTFPEKTGG